MGCYWGCGTKGNQITWGVIISFLVIGVGLLLGGAIGGTLGGGTNCFSVYNDCTGDRGTSLDARDYCATLANDQCLFILWVALIAGGLACIVLGGTLPMIYFAFSSDPDEDDDDYDAPVAPAKTYGAMAPMPSINQASVPQQSSPANPYGMLMPHPPQGPPPANAMY